MREVRLYIPDDTVAVALTLIARHDGHPTKGNVVSVCTYTVNLSEGQDEVRMDYDPGEGFFNIRSLNSKIAELPSGASEINQQKGMTHNDPA